MDKILLRGIFIENINNYKEEEDNNYINTIVEDNKNFWDELEKTYEIQENKKETTDLACWSCSLFFEDKAWGIPIFTNNDIINERSEEYHIHNNTLDSTSRLEKKITFYYGNFCSICCAMRYLLESIELPSNYKQIYKNLLYYTYEKVVGHRITYIPPAHPKTKMKIYCGKDGWSEEEYREKNRILEKYMII